MTTLIFGTGDELNLFYFVQTIVVESFLHGLDHRDRFTFLWCRHGPVCESTVSVSVDCRLFLQWELLVCIDTIEI